MRPVLNPTIENLIYAPIGKHGAAYASSLISNLADYLAEHIDNQVHFYPLSTSTYVVFHHTAELTGFTRTPEPL